MNAEDRAETDGRRGVCETCGGPTLPPGRPPDPARLLPTKCADCLWGPVQSSRVTSPAGQNSGAES